MTEGPAPAAVEARGLRKAFGDVVAVDGIDLVAYRGRCLGLLGPNGAGKTTTIEMLEGLTAPDAGSVRVLGLDWAHDASTIRERIGVSLQETRLPDRLSPIEVLRVFRSFYRRGRDPDELLDRVGLTAKRKARVVNLSGGQAQRLALACALVNEPDVLFLDEPTTGLDPQARRHVWELIEEGKARGQAVLLTTHYMDEAERLADDLVIVDQGRVIAEGSPDEVISSIGGSSVISYAVAGPEGGDAVGLDDETLHAIPGVSRVMREPGRAQLAVDDPRAALPHLVARLAERGLEIAELNTHRATLEDVFVHLTGRHLRDD